MKINADLHAKALILRLQNGERRLGYAAVKAINNTLKKVQQAQRSRLHREFTVRKVKFMERQIAIIKPWANVRHGRPYGEVSVGDKKRLLLERFESGGLRRPVKGKRVAVPVTGGPARPSFKHAVKTEFIFTRLRLRRPGKARGRTSTSANLKPAAVGRKGQQRTFMLLSTAKHPLGGVFQRVGPGQDDIRMVYSFRPPMRLRARLRWLRTAKAVAAQWFTEYFEREATAAVAHARGRTAGT